MEKYSHSAISIANSTWRTFMGKPCARMPRLSLSFSLSASRSFCVFVCVHAHFVQLSFCRISTAGHARHAAADLRDICPDQSGIRYSRSEGLADRAGGVINHRPLCSVERENIVPGGTATWRILLFSLFCGIRHSQLTLFSNLYY